MDLRALALLRAIEPGTATTFRGALQRVAADDDRLRLAGTLLLNATEHPEVVRGVLKAPRFEPPLRLAANHFCWWKVMR